MDGMARGICTNFNDMENSTTHVRMENGPKAKRGKKGQKPTARNGEKIAKMATKYHFSRFGQWSIFYFSANFFYFRLSASFPFCTRPPDSQSKDVCMLEMERGVTTLDGSPDQSQHHCTVMTSLLRGRASETLHKINGFVQSTEVNTLLLKGRGAVKNMWRQHKDPR